MAGDAFAEPRRSREPHVIFAPERRPVLLAVVAGGGLIGSLARVGVAELLPPSAGGMPWGTLVANLSGSFALAVVAVALVERGRPRPYARLFLGVGAIGGYTTFSTLMVETDRLVRGGSTGTAAAYLVGTVAAGLAASWAGLTVGRALPKLTLHRQERR